MREDQYDYIINKPELNEDTLAHYGIKGMKWRKHINRLKNNLPGAEKRRKQKYIASKIAEGEQKGRYATVEERAKKFSYLYDNRKNIYDNGKTASVNTGDYKDNTRYADKDFRSTSSKELNKQREAYKKRKK